MEEILLVVIAIALLIRWRVLAGRMARLGSRIDYLELNSGDVRLIARVYALEQAVEALRQKPSSDIASFLVAARPEYAGEPASAEPVVAAPEPVPVAVAPNLCAHCGQPVPPPPAVCDCQRTESAAPLEPVPSPAPVAATAPLAALPATDEPLTAAETPTIAGRLRNHMPGEDWEATVGASWTNKLGVFVLVIGIALLLGYSFTMLGPLGRVGIGLAASLAMLVGGMVLERHARYTIFARGLLGGGWGALYFTIYAMHAIDAAKVIDSALAGSLLLLLVAAGMIGHSLRYRSQTVTGLAYLLAFATLSPAISPVTALSVSALVPLAASLLYVANRFEWPALALFGLLATYGTCASRGDSDAPVWTAQAIFTTYWILFEAYDLLRARRRTAYNSWERAILPLNALGFSVLSYAKWSAAAPRYIYALAAGTAAAYLLSAVLRALLRPPSSFATEADTLDRAFSGGYEGPVTMTAALTLAAIFLKLHGTLAGVALLSEAELFFLAGLYFRQAYPRQLAVALFAGGAVNLLANELPSGGKTWLGRWSVEAWAPVPALAAVLFYVNRSLRSTDKFYGYAGCAAIALILGFETPQPFLGTAWFALAAVLFAFGWSRQLRDFRIQGYFAALLGFGATALHQASVASGIAPPFRHPWLALTCAALFSYAGVQCALRSAACRLEGWERDDLRRLGSWATTGALAALAWRVLPSDYVGLGWLAIAMLLLEAGLRGWPRDFRKQSYGVATLGALQVLTMELIPIANAGALAPRWTIAGAALLAYAFAARIYRVPDETVARGERSAVFHTASTAGTILALAALWALLPAVAVGPAWAFLSLMLIEIGFALDEPGLRLQGHLAAGAALGRLFFTNFTGLGGVGFLSHRLLTVVPVICSQYYQWSRQRAAGTRLKDWERSLGRIYLYAAAIAGVVLMRFELGRVVAVAGWAAFALGLSILGNRWKVADLRWQSYALSALSFWRSWTTNFDAPESFVGVSGRVLTGAFVVACFYAAHMLAPRRTADDTGLERHARLFYSTLANGLLAVLLFYEVSGSMLTVAWGTQGVALLLMGFPLRDRVFRVSGLALFLVCVAKLFFYDLRHLETVFRILSFIALGVMLVSVSWIYTRYRDRIRRYL